MTLELRRLADLSDDDLAEAYAPPRGPWLRVNFVSTVDGAAQGGDGLSKSINNAADKRVFDTLRRRADCLVVGAGTLRAEGYDVPRVPLVVVSRSADVPPTLRGAPRGRILMATVASADGLAAAREELGEENVLVLGEDEIDLPLRKRTLAERGFEVPDRAGVRLHHVMTVYLDAGSIEHVVNDTGARVDSSAPGAPSYVVDYPAS